MAKNLPKAERVAKRAKAWRLAQRGKPQAAIADELGVSQATVSRWLARQAGRVVERLDDEARVALVTSIRQTDRMIESLWAAWEKSCQPQATRTQKREPGVDGVLKLVAQIDVGSNRDGNPAFLDRIQAAIRYRNDLLQIDRRFAPKEDDGPKGATLADAVAEAHARDAGYIPDPDDEAPAE